MSIPFQRLVNMDTFLEPSDPETDPAFGYTKVDEVDSLSTNQFEQMDREKEETEKEEVRSTTPSDGMKQLSTELQAGYKILCDLMSESKKATNWPFMESVEISAPDLYDDYKKHIEKPMWLKMMRQKFENQTYGTITDFVSDFRLMLENCYRYNGPDHYVSKRGQKLEIMLEQKLALLPRDLREKTSIEATSGIKQEDAGGGLGLRRRPKTVVPHDSTVLLNQLREAEQQKVREYRKQQLIDRRAEKEALVQEIHDWEDKVLFVGQTREHMRTMWELPQIGLFLFLCQEPLNIGEVMQFELERSFLMPRESGTMQLVMTSLVSTPFQRLKLSKKTLMPYNVWEQKLRVKVQQWYKVYTDSGFNLDETCLKLGLEDQFFDVVGNKNPLERRKYHELSFCKKVWIMKGLCDNCMYTQENLREAIENQPFHDQREYLLGTDAQGQRYIHFPQFCGADVRIYRQAAFKYPKLVIKPDPFDHKRKFPLVYKPPPLKKMKMTKSKRVVDTSSPSISPVRQRPSRLRQTVKTVVPLQLGVDSSDSESSSREDDLGEEGDEEEEGDLTNECQQDTLKEKEAPGSDENDLTDTKEEDRLSCGSDATIPYCDRSDCNSSASSRDCSRESSPYLSQTDLGLRRSARFDKYSDTSRDASPLIFDSDFGLRRSSRNRARLKNIPPLRAARNITNLLMDENSTTSNSSAFCGENSLSGVWKGRLMTNENSRSSDNEEEESNDCDMYKKIFSYSKQDKADDDWTQSEDKASSSVVGGRGKLFESKDLVTDTTEDSEQMDISMNEICSKTRESADESVPVSEDEKEGDVDCGDEETMEIGETACIGSKGGIAYASGKVQEIVGTNQSDLKMLDDEQSVESEFAENARKDSEGLAASCTDSEVENDEHRNHDEESGHKVNGSVNDGENVIMNDTGKDSHPGLNGYIGHNGDFESETPIKLTTVKSEHAEDDHSERGKSEILVKSHQNVQGDEQESESTESSHGSKSEVQVQEHEHKTNANIDKEDDKTMTCDLIVKTEPPDELDENVAADIKGGLDDDKDLSERTLEIKKECSELELANSVKEEVKSVDNIKDEIKQEANIDDNINDEKNISKFENCENKTVEDNDIKKMVDAKMADVKSEEPESEEEEDMAPDPSQFELLAESVEELRRLISQFAEPEPIVIRKGKKEQITYPPPRKRNVVILHERLEFLLKELEPWESKLQQANRRARIRIRKEKEDYEEPPPDQDDQWNSTDEETESGNSDDETKVENADVKEDRSLRNNLNRVAKGTEAQAGVQGTAQEVDEIDVSQRGRLRKRRIIPNNVEDQLAAKKPKITIKSETVDSTKPLISQPSSNQPIIIHSGKPQMVDYSDILRQLRSVNSSGSQMPILIRTTQGGRTVLTSVLPISSTSVAAAGLNTLVSSTSQPAVASRTHPTIQTLLTASLPSPGFNIIKPTSSIQTLPQSSTRSIMATKIPVQPGASSGKPFTPLKIQLAPAPAPVTSQVTDTQALSLSPKPAVQQLATPKKIAPHTQSTASSASGAKVKYYPANASTLPINVVQQLLATRGAKLQTGPNQQSILYIPMETEGLSRNAATPIKHQFLSPVKRKLEKTDTGAETPQSSAVVGVTVATTLPVSFAVTGVNSVASSSGPMLILPKSQIVMAKSSVGSITPSVLGSQVLQGILPTGSIQTANIVTASGKEGVVTIKPLLQGNPQTKLSVDVTKTYHTIPPTSPPRYPTNETVRTLLDKKKSGDEKPPAIRQATPSTYPCIVSQLQGAAPQPMPSTVLLKASPKRKSSVASTEVTNTASSSSLVDFASMQPSSFSDSSVDESTFSVKMQNAQPCVITSISPAKLNTLLLQTTAAGAKSIPSLIKLPSKAMLDSAVKAVVTSVNTTLPTVNIKVPAPTSLPSIGPRRNVTKTIQTMKSPIPVAPKVITQSSGNTTLSIANSNSISLTHQVSASGSPLTVPGTAPFMSAIAPSSTGAGSSATGQKNQLAAVLQDVDGKKILTKVAPQTFLTSNGLVQVGYMTPQGMIIPKLQQSGAQQTATTAVKQEPCVSPSLQGVQLVQNSAGQLQLVQRTSPVLQHAAVKTNLVPMASPAQAASSTAIQGVRPVIALNSSGNPLLLPPGSTTAKPVQQVITNLTTSSPTAILPKSSLINHATPIKPSAVSRAVTPQPSRSPVMGRSLKSPVSIVGETQPTLKPPQSPVLMAKPPLSPVINMQPGFIIPNTGLQLPNQLGVNLIQPGVAMQTAFVPTSQKLNLLPTSAGNPGSLQLYLNQSNSSALTGNKLVLQSPSTSQMPIAATKSISSSAHPVSSLGHIRTSQYQAVSQTQVNVGKLVLQQASSGTMQSHSTPILSHARGLPGVQVQNVVKNLNTTFTSEVDMKRNLNTLTPPAAPVAQRPLTTQIQQLSSTTVNQVMSPQQCTAVSPATLPQTVATKGSDAGALVKSQGVPHQQKLLLFSIGGQLVTGQGVPVTLSDGVLKLMPQAKVQIANQTLSPEQIQQTLSKINHAAAANFTSTNHIQNPSALAISNLPHAKVTQNSAPSAVNLPYIQHAQNSSPLSAGTTSVTSVHHEVSQQVVRHLDHSYQHKVQKVLTVPVSLSTSGGMVPGIARLSPSTNIQSMTAQLVSSAHTLGKHDSITSRPEGLLKPASQVSLGSATLNDHYSKVSLASVAINVNNTICNRTSALSGNSDKVLLSETKKIVRTVSVAKPGGYVNGNENNGRVSPKQADWTPSRDAPTGNACNSHLVLDEKEAALNLLTLANQGLEHMMVGENKVDNSGDARN